MAFNTTADFVQTAGDIIDEALEIIGVLSEGETASTAQQTSGLRTLNQIIKSWSADTQIYAQGEYQLDLNPAFPTTTNYYQLGVSNVGYIPNKIINATLIDTTTDQEIPIKELTQEEWYALTDKSTEARPTQYFWRRKPVGVDMDFYTWPTPLDQQYDIKLWLQYPLRDTDLVTDDVYFTQEWFLALSFQLAALLAFKYGMELGERQLLMQTADQFRFDASTYDTDGSVYFQPGNNNG